MQFSWQARRGICIGVAKGLAFLHEEVHPRIVHRDIKASNILLDRYLQPRISDFGLAKLFPDNMTHISTRVAGTSLVRNLPCPTSHLFSPLSFSFFVYPSFCSLFKFLYWQNCVIRSCVIFSPSSTFLSLLSLLIG